MVVFFTDAPAPGNATKAKALEGLNAAEISITVFLQLTNQVEVIKVQENLEHLAPGVYKSASGTYQITNGDLTLDAQGNENATWYFQSASSLTVGSPAASRSVKLINGAKANNVYWYVGSSAVNYAGGGVMVGNVIANNGVTSAPANSTTLPGAETVLNGRAISLVSSVTMVNTIINVPVN
jgi:hypothetical protein